MPEQLELFPELFRRSDDPEVPQLETVVAEFGVQGQRAGTLRPILVEKPWGHETIFANNDRYCGKQLSIWAGKATSFHFHLDKHETMYVIRGTLFIDYILDKETRTAEVRQGEAFQIVPGMVHSLRAGEKPVVFIESSTPSYDKDSIRIA